MKHVWGVCLLPLLLHVSLTRAEYDIIRDEPRAELTRTESVKAVSGIPPRTARDVGYDVTFGGCYQYGVPDQQQYAYPDWNRAIDPNIRRQPFSGGRDPSFQIFQPQSNPPSFGRPVFLHSSPNYWQNNEQTFSPWMPFNRPNSWYTSATEYRPNVNNPYYDLNSGRPAGPSASRPWMGRPSFTNRPTGASASPPWMDRPTGPSAPPPWMDRPTGPSAPPPWMDRPTGPSAPPPWMDRPTGPSAPPAWLNRPSLTNRPTGTPPSGGAQPPTIVVNPSTGGKPPPSQSPAAGGKPPANKPAVGKRGNYPDDQCWYEGW